MTQCWGRTVPGVSLYVTYTIPSGLFVKAQSPEDFPVTAIQTCVNSNRFIPFPARLFVPLSTRGFASQLSEVCLTAVLALRPKSTPHETSLPLPH